MAIQLSKNGNAVKFDFDDNSHYLNDGTIEVPVNSLTLVTDESNMFTFKKAASDDIFISGLYSEIGMSKAELIAWYKDNMVGSTGGGGGGVTSGEVQTMIDESISGKADTSDVATVSGNVQTLSGQVETDEKVTATALVDLNDRLGDKADTSAVTASIASATSGMATQQWVYEQGYVDSGSLEGYATEEWVQEQGYASASRVNEVEEVTARALVDLDEKKADVSAMTASLSGKQDTLIAGSGITIDSANTISCTVTGGGATYSAGTNISISTANTISCTLPITAGTTGGISINRQGNNAGTRSFAGGEGCNASSTDSFAFGLSNTASSTGSTAFGFKTNTNVYSSFVCGKWNDVANANTGENFGSSGNTVFAVGNGWKQNDWTSGNASKHNAIDIRQNGDIYIANTDDTTSANFYEKPMYRLQDIILAMGGLKLVSISQADYDLLPVKDQNTLYIITNVVN